MVDEAIFQSILKELNLLSKGKWKGIVSVKRDREKRFGLICVTPTGESKGEVRLEGENAVLSIEGNITEFVIPLSSLRGSMH
jgi:hypothetical protein